MTLKTLLKFLCFFGLGVAFTLNVLNLLHRDDPQCNVGGINNETVYICAYKNGQQFTFTKEEVDAARRVEYINRYIPAGR